MIKSLALISMLILHSTFAVAEDKKMSKEELKNKLSPDQYHITQEGGTEPAFRNKYWDNKAEGIYVDVVSGEALFSSTDKYDSGTGWPSFTKTIKQGVAETKEDLSFGMVRTEIKSNSGSHLGHVFDDGPKDKGGKRFCINSGSLRFIPEEKMIDEGYGEYLYLFLEK